MDKSEYIRPVAESVCLPLVQNLLVSFSMESGFEDFQEGNDL